MKYVSYNTLLYFWQKMKAKFAEKYDKAGGEITGNVIIDGNLTLNIPDDDYDAGIRFTKALDNNAGTVLTLTGYANGNGDNTNYKPVIRNVSDPQNNYDVANKHYVDAQIVRPLSYFVFLNPDGTIDVYSSQLNYATVKAALTSMTTNVYLDVIQDQTRFYVQAIQDMDVNNGPIKFMGLYSKDGNIVEIEFNLASDNTLTHSIRVVEHTGNKVQSVVANPTSASLYPSTAAIFSEFQRKPVVVWEAADIATGILASGADITASPTWQLTGLDMTPFKRVKLFIRSGGTGSYVTASLVLEVDFDALNQSDIGGHYIVSGVVQNPNNRNRLLAASAAVSADKTSVMFMRETSLYGTAATGANDTGRVLYKIEGYYD